MYFRPLTSFAVAPSARVDDLDQFADRAGEIYAERYQEKLEKTHTGQFAAVVPDTGRCYVDPTLEGAVARARSAEGPKPCHLIRVGRSAAYRVLPGGSCSEWKSPTSVITLAGSRGSRTIEGFIDTGFDGCLLIPIQKVGLLGLTTTGSTELRMSNGQTLTFHVTEVSVTVRDKTQKVPAIFGELIGEGDVLIGMEFLERFGLSLLIHDDKVELVDLDIAEHSLQELDRIRQKLPPGTQYLAGESADKRSSGS